MRGRPAIARFVKEYRLGQTARHDWCESEDLQRVCCFPLIFGYLTFMPVCDLADIFHSSMYCASPYSGAQACPRPKLSASLYFCISVLQHDNSNMFMEQYLE